MADAKFEIYNADGSLQFDLSNRLFRTLGSFDTGTSDGSTTVAGTNTGTPIIRQSAPTTGTAPSVTVSGGTVSWSFGGTPSTDRVNASVEVLVY